METVVAVGVVAFPEASGGDTETYEILSLIFSYWGSSLLGGSAEGPVE